MANRFNAALTNIYDSAVSEYSLKGVINNKYTTMGYEILYEKNGNIMYDKNGLIIYVRAKKISNGAISGILTDGGYKGDIETIL